MRKQPITKEEPKYIPIWIESSEGYREMNGGAMSVVEFEKFRNVKVDSGFPGYAQNELDLHDPSNRENRVCCNG